MTLTPRELATVLAALRRWQEEWTGHHLAPSHLRKMEHFTEERPLTMKQIDQLCERLNTPPTKQWAAYMSMTKYSVEGTTLYPSYREALEAVAEFYEVAIYDEEQQGNPAKDDATLYDDIEELSDGESWHIQEVETP